MLTGAGVHVVGALLGDAGGELTKSLGGSDGAVDRPCRLHSIVYCNRRCSSGYALDQALRSYQMIGILRSVMSSAVCLLRWTFVSC